MFQTDTGQGQELSPAPLWEQGANDEPHSRHHSRIVLITDSGHQLAPVVQQLGWHGVEIRTTTSALDALGQLAEFNPEVLWIENLDSDITIEEIFDALATPRLINPISIVVSQALNASTSVLPLADNDEILDLRSCVETPGQLLQLIKVVQLERRVIQREHEIFDSLPNALFVVDEHLTLWKVNRRLAELLEIRDKDYRRKALGRSLGAGFAAAGLPNEGDTPLPKLVHEIEHCLRTKRARFRVKELIGGSERLLSGEITPLVHSSRHSLIDLRDITADEHAVLFQARRERLATIGNLAVGVAHEIQNPNTFSRVNAANLKMMFDAVKPVVSQAAAAMGGKLGAMPAESFLQKMSEAISAVDMASRRIETVLGTLKSFGRNDDGEIGVVSLKEVVDEAVLLVRHEARGKAEIHADVATDLPQVIAQSTGLSQVLVNLLQNAIHALDARAPSANLEPPTIRVKCEAVNADEVVLSVSDNGPGIPESLQEKIFRPYFTTKPQGQGTGLGLSISVDILHRFGGDLTLRSREHHGATFYIKLRRQDEPSLNS